MALEPMAPTAEEEENAELLDMTRRFWVSTALTVPLIAIAMGHFISGHLLVPAVVLIAVITFVLWATIGPEPRMAYAIVNAVAVLIIACPCALGLATPMSIMVSTGKGAQAGVLFRNAEAIEVMRQVDTLVVDKTGTLTIGKPTLISVRPTGTFDESAVLRYAASLECTSEHPLAAAIVAGAEERGTKLTNAQSFASVTGKGGVGRIDGREIALGNTRLMEERGVEVAALASHADSLRREGQTVMFVASTASPLAW